MLERGKKYKLSAITLIALLLSRCVLKERGHWWHRLGMNLKHLKMKKEAFQAMNIALKDEFVAGEKLNSILKYRLTLFIDLNKGACKNYIKNSQCSLPASSFSS